MAVKRVTARPVVRKAAKRPAVKRAAGAPDAVTWIIPSFGDPEGLEAGLGMLGLEGAPASAVVIVETGDTSLLAYMDVIRAQAALGRRVGAVYSRRGCLCGAVNRAAYAAGASRSLCVISGRAVPQGAPLYGAVEAWLDREAPRPDDAAVGLFSPDGESCHRLFPLVSAGAVGRLGYLWHPVCMFRRLAERWLIDVAGMAGRLTAVPGVTIAQDGFDGREPDCDEYRECLLVYERHLPGIRRIDAGRIAGGRV